MSDYNLVSTGHVLLHNRIMLLTDALQLRHRLFGLNRYPVSGTDESCLAAGPENVNAFH